MRKNRAHESDYTQAKTHKNQNTFKSRLNGQPQLTIIQVAKLNPITKESLTMTSIALWTAFLKSLDQQLLLTEQLMLQTIL
jgi:hypothetical protein